MKTTFIFAALFATLGAAAQMPSMNVDSTASQQPVPQVPTVQAMFNTPSESYKNERNSIRRGNSFFNKNDYHHALEAYNKALEVNSEIGRAHV